MTREGAELKLLVLRDNLEKLPEIPQASYEEFASDFRNLDSALHRLQTSIQALIDLASLATAERGLGAPSSARDALQRLEDAHLLPDGSTLRFTPLLGFRNRVVRLYDRIDARIVYEILVNERGDLEELAELLLRAVGA